MNILLGGLAILSAFFAFLLILIIALIILQAFGYDVDALFRSQDTRDILPFEDDEE